MWTGTRGKRPSVQGQEAMLQRTQASDALKRHTGARPWTHSWGRRAFLGQEVQFYEWCCLKLCIFFCQATQLVGS